MLSGLNAGNQVRNAGRGGRRPCASMLSGLNAGNQGLATRMTYGYLSVLQCCPA